MDFTRSVSLRRKLSWVTYYRVPYIYREYTLNGAQIVFIFLIKALGPISCKNMNKFSDRMSQKPISRKPSNSAYSIRHDYAGQSVPRKG